MQDLRDIYIAACRSQADIVKSLLRVKAAPKVKLKHESGQDSLRPAAKRVKAEPKVPIKVEQVIKIEEDDAGEKEEGDGLAGLLGKALCLNAFKIRGTGREQSFSSSMSLQLATASVCAPSCT